MWGGWHLFPCTSAMSWCSCGLGWTEDMYRPPTSLQLNKSNWASRRLNKQFTSAICWAKQRNVKVRSCSTARLPGEGPGPNTECRWLKSIGPELCSLSLLSDLNPRFQTVPQHKLGSLWEQASRWYWTLWELLVCDSHVLHCRRQKGRTVMTAMTFLSCEVVDRTSATAQACQGTRGWSVRVHLDLVSSLMHDEEGIQKRSSATHVGREVRILHAGEQASWVASNFVVGNVISACMYPSIYLSSNLPTHQSIYLSVYLSVYHVLDIQLQQVLQTCACTQSNISLSLSVTYTHNTSQTVLVIGKFQHTYACYVSIYLNVHIYIYIYMYTNQCTVACIGVVLYSLYGKLIDKYVHIRMHNTLACIHTHIQTYIHVYTYTYLYVCVNIHLCGCESILIQDSPI